MSQRHGVALAAAALSVVSGAAVAAPGILSTGGQFSTGGVTTGRAMPALQSNPSLLPLTLKGDQRFRVGVFELPAVGLEIGPVDNFTDDLDRVEELLDQDFETEEQAQAAIDEINPILVEIGDSAYVNLDVSLPVPVFPVVFRAGLGVFSVHADISGAVRIDVLDDPLRIDKQDEMLECDQVTSDNTSNCRLATDSSVYLRSGAFARVGVGYGQPLMNLPLLGREGSLHVGGRLSVIQGRMSQQVARLDSDEEDSAFDRAGDNYDLNEKTSTGVSADVGVSWVSEGLHAGLQLRNLIAPSFDFGPIGIDCDSKPTPTEQTDCEAAALFADEIDLAGKFTMDPQLMAEVVYTVPNTQLRLLGSVELNKVENVGGDDFQNFFVGLNYEGPWWLPGARIGYQSNLAGEKLSALTGGVTLFGAVNIDLLYGLEKVNFEGDSLPRSAAVRIGFAVPFN
jgi:hypothetical protein